MAWLATDRDGTERIIKAEPYRACDNYWEAMCDDDGYITLPDGSIEKLIGRKLTWEDEPVEI